MTAATTDMLQPALDRLLKSNFDADTKTCLLTITKLVDNILKQPYSEKIRNIRLQNAAIQTKITCRPGGVDVLLACGWKDREQAAQLLSNGNSNISDQVLTLPEDADITKLYDARRQIQNVLVNTMNIPENQIPEMPPLPQPRSNVGDGSYISNAPNNFDVYRGQRFNAQAAAMGQSGTDSEPYVSTTEQALKVLQQKQQKLEEKLQKERDNSTRNWKLVDSTAGSSSKSDNASGEGLSDAALLAKRAQKQAAERQQRENGGFTTKSMRELQALKAQKVYSQAQLTFQFPSSTATEATNTRPILLTGSFAPSDSIESVIQALQQDCLRDSNWQLELVVTPPPQVLSPPSLTLQKAGLVPAAKLHVRWKANQTIQQPLFQEHLYKAAADAGTMAYPTGIPIEGGASNDKEGKRSSETPAATNVTPQDREEALLQRMLGKKGGLGGGMKKKSTSAAADSSDKSSSTGGTDATKKPKWFKK